MQQKQQRHGLNRVNIRREWTVKEQSEQSYTAHNGNLFITAYQPKHDSNAFRVELGAINPADTIHMKDELTAHDVKEVVKDWSFAYRNGSK